MEGTTTNAAARSGVRLMVTRVLAVLAVAGAAIALYVVISGSLDTSDGEEHANGGSKHHHQQQSGDQSPETPETYVVQPGETMGGIAAKVGVPIERLEELNPQIDPQALPSGAVLKLR